MKESTYTNGTPVAIDAGYYYSQIFNTLVDSVTQDLSQFELPAPKFVAGASIGNLDFLETVINETEGKADVISFHYYNDSSNNTQCNFQAISILEDQFMAVRGYMATELPILISEGALRYGDHPTPTPTGVVPTPTRTPTPGNYTPTNTPTRTPDAAFYNCQAQFATNLQAWAKGKQESGKLLGFIWYTIGVNEWRETDLLYPSGAPKPVYYTWRDLEPVLFLPLEYNDYGAGDSLSAGQPGEVESGVYPPPEDDSGSTIRPNPYPLPGDGSPPSTLTPTPPPYP